MSDHPRKQIRYAVKNILSGNTDCGAKVYTNRYLPWWETELPALSIYSASEKAEYFNEAPVELERKLNLVIEIAAEASAQADDILDAIALEVENQMAADDTLGETASRSVLTGTELDVDEQGEKEIAFLRMTFEVAYFTRMPATAPADNFADADFVIDVGNNEQKRDYIEGNVTIPTE